MSSCTLAAPEDDFGKVCEFSNLYSAWKKASKGKRRSAPAAAFECGLADALLELKSELERDTYRPGPYTHFYIHEPKRRRISAAPFRDRVVHHALCNVIEPILDGRFIPDSYANRRGKGTHRAVDRLQRLAQSFDYVLRLDIVKHFPAIDHGILLDILGRHLHDERTLSLAGTIIDSGKGVLDQEYEPALFPGDDLLALCRPRGLPIGNLTSQFWSNCYLHPLDTFVKRELQCKGYVRYVDDFALFSNSKQQLWEWKEAVHGRLETLRLRFHEHSAQVVPVRTGIPWLGFVVYPQYRRLKRRKVVCATRRLRKRYEEWRRGKITFGELDASVQGWINHVRYADSWGLRRHVLARVSA
ncbi:MAG: RNA-dependent DNA polymerase [Gammaproteobacteria bacterium]|nr:RNA-dependent DNA polymerase [Gammaproteobacteria bacterium]